MWSVGSDMPFWEQVHMNDRSLPVECHLCYITPRVLLTFPDLVPETEQRRRIPVSFLLQGCPSLGGVWNFVTSYEKVFQYWGDLLQSISTGCPRHHYICYFEVILALSASAFILGNEMVCSCPGSVFKLSWTWALRRQRVWCAGQPEGVGSADSGPPCQDTCWHLMGCFRVGASWRGIPSTGIPRILN